MKLRFGNGQTQQSHFFLCWCSLYLKQYSLQAFISSLSNISTFLFSAFHSVSKQLLLVQNLSTKILVKTLAPLYNADNSPPHETSEQPFVFNTTVYFRKVIGMFPHLSSLSGSLFKHGLTYKELWSDKTLSFCPFVTTLTPCKELPKECNVNYL